jgi:predicted aspartyl protease
MKKIALLAILTFTLSTQLVKAQTANEVVGKLLNEQNWFELKTQHAQLKGELYPMLDYLSQAMLSVAFYKPEAGLVAIDSLLSSQEYQTQLGFGNVCNMMLVKAKLHADRFQYKEASELLGDFIAQAGSYFSADFKSTVKAYCDYYTVLSEQAQLTIHKPQSDCSLACEILTKNNKSLLSIQCQINGKGAQMIFDTGNPSFSLVSEKFAKQYGIKKISDSMPISGVQQGNGWIGIADSLGLGGIMCYNPVFYVVDSILPKKAIENGAIAIDAVLGSNILFQIGEFQYFPKQNSLVFPEHKTLLPQGGQNLMMRDDRHQYIQVYLDGERRQMHFDMGAARSGLSSGYYHTNKSWIDKNASKDSANYAGFGGVSSQVIYSIPEFNLTLGSKEYTFDNIEVQTEPSHSIWQDLGVIGFDFISTYNKITVSYANMFIAIE